LLFFLKRKQIRLFVKGNLPRVPIFAQGKEVGFPIIARGKHPGFPNDGKRKESRLQEEDEPWCNPGRSLGMKG
jgi:hypothetical protein